MNNENTLKHITDLTNPLEARLHESEDARCRLTKALDASGWPDLRSTSTQFVDRADDDDEGGSPT